LQDTGPLKWNLHNAQLAAKRAKPQNVRWGFSLGTIKVVNAVEDGPDEFDPTVYQGGRFLTFY
jgi:hypothetical protein